MKKIVSIIFLFYMLVSFTACKDKNTVGPSASNDLSITQILPKNVVTGATVSITGTNLKDVTSVIFPGGIPATSFQFVGLNQISAIAPAGMTDGFIILKTSALQVTATMAVKVVTPAYTSQFPDTAKIGKVITILGTNLLEVQQIVFPNNVIVSDLAFNRKSDTEIQVTIPVGAAIGKGMLKMITLSGASINLGYVVVQSAAYVPVTLGYVFYEDAVTAGWNEWGWGRDAVYTSTEQVLSGLKSMKITYTAQWSGVAFQSGNVATGPYTQLCFSVYGGPGTDGKVVFAKLNWNDPSVNCTIQEGKWTHFAINLSALAPGPITVLMLGNQGWTGVVYFDHIGLK
jgi:hypothetical protein